MMDSSGKILNPRDPNTYCAKCGQYYSQESLADRHCHYCGKEVPAEAKLQKKRD